MFLCLVPLFKVTDVFSFAFVKERMLAGLCTMMLLPPVWKALLTAITTLLMAKRMPVVENLNVDTAHAGRYVFVLLTSHVRFPFQPKFLRGSSLALQVDHTLFSRWFEQSVTSWFVVCVVCMCTELFPILFGFLF